MQAGTRLGPYEILSAIGAGGMGEVYRARDTRLDRDVAIKVLPGDFLEGEERQARFGREARLLAALNHPNIAAIYSFEEIPGSSPPCRHMLVMELLEGEPLRAVLVDGPLPVRRALDVADQIAEALAAAHENGIVHRDVKPENVFVGPDGRVKLIDFGLARNDGSHREAGDTRSPTVTNVSHAGNAAGTVAYMSPEQAKGEPVDHRSDQFSLGIVLYEMLTGLRPFRGGSKPETLTSIIREEPEPLEKVAPAVPAPVRWIVERCLAKEPAGRFESTRDLAKDLATCRVHLSDATSKPVGVEMRRPRPRMALAGLIVALAAAAAFAFLFTRESQRMGPATGRFEIRLPEGYFLEPYRNALALSPDGRLLVFSAFTWKKPYEEPGDPQLFLRPLDALDSRPIPGTEGGFQPVFSPDGRHVAFVVEAEKGTLLKRVPAAGGAVQTICQCDARFGAAWTPDGSLLFASPVGPLQKVPATGGTPVPVTTLDVPAAEISHRLPHLLPDGRTVVYTALRWRENGGRTWKNARIYVGHPGEKERSLLVEAGSDGRWAPPGVLVFAREGNLRAAPFDPTVQGRSDLSEPFLEGVRHVINTGRTSLETGTVHLALSAEGLLAWAPGFVNPQVARSKVWVDASGKETPLEGGPITGTASGSRVSADGKHVLLNYNYPGVQTEVVDLARGVRRQATFDVYPGWPIWGPGPDQFTFTSDHDGPMGLYIRRLDAGPEEIETLWKPADASRLALGSWSRDGKVLVFLRYSPTTQKNDIWILETGKEPRPLVVTRFNELWPDISPDGRWLAYTSDASGRHEVFVRALSGEGDAMHVSNGEGWAPLWSRDGANVYYFQPVEGKPGVSALFRVPVTKTAGSLSFGVPMRLFEGRYYIDGPGHLWDVAPDGRFLVGKPPDEAALRGFWDKILSNRIIVDTGGVERLMAQGEKPVSLGR